MKNKNKLIKISQYIHTPSIGSFAFSMAKSIGDIYRDIRLGDHDFDSCRECFHDDIEGEKPIFIGFSSVHVGRFSKFWALIEAAVGIKKSVIYETDFRGVVIIKINQWWNEDRFRQEMMTVLMRCGNDYKNSLWSAIYRNRHGNALMACIKLFLEDGYTKGRKPCDGFQAQLVSTCGGAGEEILKSIFMEKA